MYIGSLNYPWSEPIKDLYVDNGELSTDMLDYPGAGYCSDYEVLSDSVYDFLLDLSGRKSIGLNGINFCKLTDLQWHCAVLHGHENIS